MSSMVILGLSWVRLSQMKASPLIHHSKSTYPGTKMVSRTYLVESDENPVSAEVGDRELWSEVL